MQVPFSKKAEEKDTTLHLPKKPADPQKIEALKSKFSKTGFEPDKKKEY